MIILMPTQQPPPPACRNPTLQVKESEHDFAGALRPRHGGSAGPEITPTGSTTDTSVMVVYATTRKTKWIIAGVAAAVVVTAAIVVAVVKTSTSSTRVTTSATTTPVTTSTGAAVNYGWDLTATNTGLAGVGVNRNTLPVFSGTVTAGMTISNVKITKALDLSGKANVTLDRVWVQVNDSDRAILLGAGTTIRDSDVDGSLMAPGGSFGISSKPGVGTLGNYTIERVNITNLTQAIYLDSGTSASTGLVTDTYVHSMLSTNGAHLDGMQRMAGTGPLTILRCRVANDYSGAGGSFATASMFLTPTWGGDIGPVTLKDSYFEGNGYNLYFTAYPNTGDSITVSLNNVRLRPTEYGPITTLGDVIFPQWTNVYLYDATKPNAAGAAVNQP